ncbi:unnamed protein product [Prorocentrum cordatum]|nr:unnamed protein product [Polarella glacialis]
MGPFERVRPRRVRLLAAGVLRGAASRIPPWCCCAAVRCHSDARVRLRGRRHPRDELPRGGPGLLGVHGGAGRRSKSESTDGARQVARPLLLMSPLHIPAKPPRAPRADRGWARRAPKVRRGVVLQRFRCQFEQPRRDSAIRGFLRTASGNLAPARNRRTCLRVLSRRQWLLRAAVVGHSASASQSSLCVHAAAL